MEKDENIKEEKKTTKKKVSKPKKIENNQEEIKVIKTVENKEEVEVENKRTRKKNYFKKMETLIEKRLKLSEEKFIYLNLFY